jgi:endonuclease/exonuclease/phosphatase family metal-dependent hydrolase
MDPARLDRVARRGLVTERLTTLDADIVCLQETTALDLDAIVAALGDGYAVHAAPNGRDLWASWTTDALPWEPNGTAILWRTDRLDAVVPGSIALSEDGNVAATVSGRIAGVDVVAVSVHLDVDRPDLRRTQLRRACVFANDVHGVAVIAGDCNEDTTGTDLGTIAGEHGYADALTAVGATEPTHPLARPEDDYAPLARLDHVLVRGAVPASGRVIDAGLWDVDDPGDRLVEALRQTGSDHLAAVATLVITPS